MKLYLVTHKQGSMCYCATPSLKSIGELYPESTKLELVSDNVIIDSCERYDLLKEAYDFIKRGANLHDNKFRVELEEKIEKHLQL